MSTDKSSITRAKWATEAQAQGWTWLSKVDMRNNLYSCNTCGSEQKICVGHMRNGKVRCTPCRNNEMATVWSSEADVHGFTWLSKIDQKRSHYLCKTCDSHDVFTMGHMHTGSVRCKPCKEHKWAVEAQLNGFTWSHRIDSNTGFYKCNVCESGAEAHTYHMRKGHVSCGFCQEQKWNKEAQLHGWLWQKRINNLKSIYRHSCGHEQDSQMSAMRNGLTACHGCGDSWATKSSNTYLLRITVDEVSFLKLGIAKDVGVRTTTYGLPDRADVEIVRTIAYPTGKEAVKHEKRIHRTIVDHPAVTRFDASYWMESGHTECYAYSKEAENALSHAMFVESLPK